MLKLVVANWKMHPATTDQAAHLVSQVEHGLLGVDRKSVETVLCPPFLYLPAVKIFSHFAVLGAQDLAPWIDDSLTGEISGEQLHNFGVRYVIIGHSERRGMGETDKQISHKVAQAVKYKLRPILCVGFGLKKNETVSSRRRILSDQVENGLSQLKEKEKKTVVIAYEPVWAVGTGEPENPASAVEALLDAGKVAPDCLLLYGGSVSAKNAMAFATEKVIDGVLVGGASLDSPEFVKIIKSFT